MTFRFFTPCASLAMASLRRKRPVEAGLIAPHIPASLKQTETDPVSASWHPEAARAPAIRVEVFELKRLFFLDLSMVDRRLLRKICLHSKAPRPDLRRRPGYRASVSTQPSLAHTASCSLHQGGYDGVNKNVECKMMIKCITIKSLDPHSLGSLHVTAIAGATSQT
jgi:hypothetical protein